jgi:hypothetical protein
MAGQARHFLFLGVLPLLLYPATASAQLRFAEPIVNVGKVYSGQPLVRQFPFVNAGSQPVEITELKGSCACVVPHLARRTFQPGEQGTIALEIHTLGQAAGANSWGVTLTCKTGNNVADIHLQLQAELITEVTCEPAALQLLVREGLSTTITIGWKSSLFPSLKSVRTSSPELTARIDPTITCDLGCSRQTVIVEVTDAFPEGRHQAVVSVYTENPAYAELRLPITIVKSSHQRVSATPGQLVLVALPGQPVSSRVVLLRDAQNESVLIENITAEHPALTCSWAAGPGEMATLKVRVDAKALPAEGLQSAVHVDIHQPVRQTVTLPVDIRRGN